MHQATAASSRGIWDDVPWYRSWWVRGPVLAVAVFDGGINSDTALNGSENPIAVRALTGGIAVAVGLLFWGGVWCLLGRLFRKRWRYLRIVTSFPLILLVWMSTAGNLARSGNPLRSSPSDAPTSQSTSSASSLSADREAFSNWFVAYTEALSSRRRAASAYRDWSKQEDPTGPQALSDLRRGLRYARAHERLIIALPPSVQAERASALFRGAARDMRRCFSRTLAIFENFDTGFSKSRGQAADRLCNRSQRRLRSGSRSGDRAFRELGGAEAMPRIADELRQLLKQRQALRSG